MQPSLPELVRRTEGLQPWRRVFHATCGVLLVLTLLAFPVSDLTLLTFLGTLLGVVLLADLIRLALPSMNRLFFRGFSLLASPREERRLASSTWYLLGITLALGLYPRADAMGGILVLSLADPAASAFGRLWGKRRLGKGTVEGSVVFALVAFGALALVAPWHHALGAAVVTATIEIIPWPVDDNLSVPLTAGGVLFLLS